MCDLTESQKKDIVSILKNLQYWFKSADVLLNDMTADESYINSEELTVFINMWSNVNGEQYKHVYNLFRALDSALNYH